MKDISYRRVILYGGVVMQCEKCNSSEMFLRKKGQDKTGLYCSVCGRWIKWVGKKELQNYTRRGMKIHPEDYILSGDISQDIDTSSATDHVHGSVQSRNSVVNDFSDILSGSSDEPAQSSSESVCPTCVSGVLDTISKSEDISLSIFDGMLIARSRDNSRLFGTFRIAHCPTCGKEVT